MCFPPTTQNDVNCCVPVAGINASMNHEAKKPVSFHSARHTFCVLLLTKDVPIYTVQQLMCHSDIGSTSVYADLLNKTKAKAVRKLPTITC